MKLKIPDEVMKLTGWNAGRAWFTRESVNKALSESKFHRKSGKWVVICSKEDAEFIADMMFWHGEFWINSADKKTRLEGRYLLNMVDQILEQVEEVKT